MSFPPIPTEPLPPVSKEEVDGSIAQLLERLAATNPLELLGQAAFFHLRSPDEVSGNGITHSEGQVEFLLSLATARPFPDQSAPATPDDIEGCLELLDATYRKATRYFTDNPGSRENENYKLIHQLRLGSLHHRGMAFGQHLERMFGDLAPAHDALLESRYGFTAAALREFILFARDSQSKALALRRGEFMEIVAPLHAEAARLLGRQPDDRALWKDWLTAPELEEFRQTHAKEVAAHLASIDALAGPSTFEVTPRHATDGRILEAISHSFGDNREFLERLPKWRGWPLNPSLLQVRPVVRHAGRHYAFHIPFLLRGVLDLVEALIRSADETYWRHSFLRQRDDYVEETAVALLEDALPGCEILRGAHYDYSEPGQTAKRVEADGVVIYDDVLLLVEAKASGLSDATRRGGGGSLASDIDESIGAAYAQAVRLLSTLRERNEVVFFDQQGIEMSRLQLSDYRHVFMILVTRESFAAISTQLPLLRRLGYLPGPEWPWVVDLHALRTLTELLPRPALLLHYIRRRLAVNDMPKLFAVDEFDLMGLFFSCDLHLPEELTKDFGIVLSWDADDEISDYYTALQSGAVAPAKPKYSLAGRAAALLDALAFEQPIHFASVSLRILDALAVNRTALEDFISGAERKFKQQQISQLAVFGNMRRPELPRFALGTSLLSDADLTHITVRAGTQKLKLGLESLTVIVWRPPLKSGRLRILEL